MIGWLIILAGIIAAGLSFLLSWKAVFIFFASVLCIILWNLVRTKREEFLDKKYAPGSFLDSKSFQRSSHESLMRTDPEYRELVKLYLKQQMQEGDSSLPHRGTTATKTMSQNKKRVISSNTAQEQNNQLVFLERKYPKFIFWTIMTFIYILGFQFGIEFLIGNVQMHFWYLHIFFAPLVCFWILSGFKFKINNPLKRNPPRSSRTNQRIRFRMKKPTIIVGVLNLLITIGIHIAICKGFSLDNCYTKFWYAHLIMAIIVAIIYHFRTIISDFFEITMERAAITSLFNFIFVFLPFSGMIYQESKFDDLVSYAYLLLKILILILIGTVLRFINIYKFNAYGNKNNESKMKPIFVSDYWVFGKQIIKLFKTPSSPTN